MRVAFLILAHNQPYHLVRLVERISRPGGTVFIHIDKKVDIGEYEYLFRRVENALFLDEKKRIKVEWGGFSMVKATLNLIDMAYRYHRKFDRYCLLSGSDYPIKNTQEIFKRLENDAEFMFIGSKLTSRSESAAHKAFIRYYHFNDNLLLKKHKLSGKLRRKSYAKIALYHGSQWFCLSTKAIEYVIDFINRNPDYIKYMKYTHCPDEIFFTSIIKSSPYSEKISFDFERKTRQSSIYLHTVQGIHYIDWSEVSNDRGSPRVLTMRDKDAIHNTNALFARKFDHNESIYLLEYIDKLIDAM